MDEQKWFEGLRRQIKHRCGPGWGIDERHGGVRLTRRIAAGKQHKNPRQTVQLGIAWNPAHSGDIFLVVCQIRERMEKGEESLAKAFQLQQKCCMELQDGLLALDQASLELELLHGCTSRWRYSQQPPRLWRRHPSCELQ